MYFELKQYGFFVHYCTPQETLIMLHLRSKLAAAVHILNEQERFELISYDRLLLHKANGFYKQLQHIPSFSPSVYPIEEWWWHLDQVIDGSLHIHLPIA
ncbi:hypothetical protein [Ectobacillus panaciterrae]|uniref:hypothetical protein n=1 Tax=Ectobacillus panaciterrae TaxID=363872 RepID=UPI00041BAA7F|nr:hypothetical protein [Ectobacillus panaciterrae]